MAARAARLPAEELTRHAVEDWIERMIALLDALDGDADPESEEADQDAGEQNERDCDLEEWDGDADAELESAFTSL